MNRSNRSVQNNFNYNVMGPHIIDESRIIEYRYPFKRSPSDLDLLKGALMLTTVEVQRYTKIHRPPHPEIQLGEYVVTRFAYHKRGYSLNVYIKLTPPKFFKRHYPIAVIGHFKKRRGYVTDKLVGLDKTDIMIQPQILRYTTPGSIFSESADVYTRCKRANPRTL